ncbi:MAG: hypothetical protein ABIY52_05695 [Gemmatimonadaceae bacterium]
MDAAIATESRDTSTARILCVGDDVSDLLALPYALDGDRDFILLATGCEVDSALAEEAYDLMIIDQRCEQVGGMSFVERLRAHSPDAEQIIVVHTPDEEVMELARNDCRVMRVLQAPVAPDVMAEAVGAALLRHRARRLRATAVPRVTPMGGNLCCTALP